MISDLTFGQWMILLSVGIGIHLVSLVVGCLLGYTEYANLIRMKALTKEKQDNTPICVDGKFYYVIEERHFIQDYGRRIEILPSPEDKSEQENTNS